MAKPIMETPVLKGKAAKAFAEYLKTAKPDPAKAEKRARALNTYRKSEKASSKPK
ncbi:MAG: hypothetical protein WD333_11400 [Dehalococcoidia bacterium]